MTWRTRPVFVSAPGIQTLPPTLSDGPWLTTVEFAARIGLSVSRVFEFMREGIIDATPAYRGRRRWRLLHERELERYWAWRSRRTESAA